MNAVATIIISTILTRQTRGQESFRFLIKLEPGMQY